MQNALKPPGSAGTKGEHCSRHKSQPTLFSSCTANKKPMGKRQGADVAAMSLCGESGQVATHRRTCAGASDDKDLIELQSDWTGWPLRTIRSELI